MVWSPWWYRDVDAVALALDFCFRVRPRSFETEAKQCMATALHSIIIDSPFPTQPMPVSNIAEVEIRVTVAQGRGLVAKDRALLSRRRTTSDPYVKVYLGEPSAPSSKPSLYLGKTAVVPKNCKNPVWNATIQKLLPGRLPPDVTTLWCVLFDSDLGTADDPMGAVPVPLTIATSQTLEWYTVQKGPPKFHCHNATGELQVAVELQGHAVRSIARGLQMSLASHASIHVGLAWDIQRGVGAVDLDSSVVAVDKYGQVDLRETVYYANLSNPNRSLLHSGDDTTGDGDGDDETISVDLNRIPAHIMALYFVLTVATPGKTLAQVTSAAVRFVNGITRKAICQFVPASECVQGSKYTALVLIRISRATMTSPWMLTPIQDGFEYARDFGSLIPEIKGYTRDLLPNIRIDPTERVAILRKGGAIRLTDYLPGHVLPSWLTFGLAWDVTGGVNIDLDASAVLLDRDLDTVDVVWFRHLQSNDGSISHSGDEREGDEEGDDEKIRINLAQVPSNVDYICFVLNSFSGQELDDVSKASCHLFDPSTLTEVAKYTLTNTAELDRHTALLVACLFRDHAEKSGSSWRLWIMSKPRQGRTVQENIPDIVEFLSLNSPPPVPVMAEEDNEIIVTAMPHVETMVEEEEITVIPMEEVFSQSRDSK